MKRSLCLVLFTLLLFSCKVDYEKRMQEFLERHTNILSYSEPTTDTNHYVIWTDKGDVYYSDLKGKDSTVLLSVGKVKTDVLSLDYLGGIPFTVSKEHNEWEYNPDKSSYDYLKLTNRKIAVLESGESEGYFIFPVNTNMPCVYVDNLKVSHSLEDGDILTTTFNDVPIEYLWDNDYEYDSDWMFDTMDKIWFDAYSEKEKYAKQFPMTVSIDATISDDLEASISDSFTFLNYKFDLNNMQDSLKRSQIFELARNEFFNTVAIPDWIQRSNTYVSLDDFFCDKTRLANQTIKPGDRFILSVSIEDIAYSDRPNYKYVISTRGVEEHLFPLLQIYTNDENFLRFQYPMYVWFMGTFERHVWGSFSASSVLTNGVLFAYREIKSSKITYVIPSISPFE